MPIVNRLRRPGSDPDSVLERRITNIGCDRVILFMDISVRLEPALAGELHNTPGVSALLGVENRPQLLAQDKKNNRPYVIPPELENTRRAAR